MKRNAAHPGDRGRAEPDPADPYPGGVRRGSSAVRILGAMNKHGHLADFLQARRRQLRPQDVGLQTYGERRRVPGLRREELAMLAGISAPYYTRLEQGQSRNASPEVLDAVANALHLDESERAHLHTLARAPRRSRAMRPTARRTRHPCNERPAGGHRGHTGRRHRPPQRRPGLEPAGTRAVRGASRPGQPRGPGQAAEHGQAGVPRRAHPRSVQRLARQGPGRGGQSAPDSRAASRTIRCLPH